MITATFVNVMARDEPALQPIEPVVWLVVGLSAIPSVAAWMHLSKKIGFANAIAAALVVESVGVALVVLINDPVGVVVGAVLFGGTFAAMASLVLHYARELSPHNVRRNIGLMIASMGLGQFIGPIFAGYAHGPGGDSFLIPSLCAAAALLVAAALVFFIKPQKTAMPSV